MADYTFRPLQRSDRLLFDDWLAQPHIGGWWRDAQTEWALVEEDMATGATDQRIVEHNGVPFAYVQDYDAHHWPMPQYADLPRGSRALDTYLGAPDFLGKGHASAYLKERSDALLAKYPVVAVDPDPENTRAVRCYENAGFVRRKTCPSEDGDLVAVMTRIH